MDGIKLSEAESNEDGIQVVRNSSSTTPTQLTFAGATVNRSEVVRNLGALLNSGMSFSQHFNQLTDKSVSASSSYVGLGAVSKLSQRMLQRW